VSGSFCPRPVYNAVMQDVPQAEEPVRRRRWFQFHLATALLLTLVAGALLWANIRSRPVTDVVFVLEAYGNLPRMKIEGYPDTTEGAAHGWPWVAYRWFEAHYNGFKFSKLYKQSVCLNVGFAVMSLATTAVISEWLIRRKRRV